LRAAHTRHSAISTRKKRKKGKKGKGGYGKSRATNEVFLPSVRVKWHTYSENGGVESTFLGPPELFNKPKRDGRG
jgi:hypothetical protein